MAEMSDFRRAQVGCVAVIGNKVVATGFSQQRTHPLQEHYNHYRLYRGADNLTARMHAEISMIASSQHLNIDWSKADVYIYRICRSRPAGISKPCKSCEMALREVGVRNVFHTTNDGFEYLRIA